MAAACRCGLAVGTVGVVAGSEAHVLLETWNLRCVYEEARKLQATCPPASLEVIHRAGPPVVSPRCHHGEKVITVHSEGRLCKNAGMDHFL